MKRNRTQPAQEEIPDMIEDILLIQKKEIARISKLSQPSANDIRMTITLMNALSQNYMTYRILKAEIKSETSQLQLKPDAMKHLIQMQQSKN